MEKGRTLSIRQAENGVILQPQTEDDRTLAIREEFVFTSFEDLLRHLKETFLMPTTATMADPCEVGGGKAR